MPPKLDFHLHSTASDGRLSPSELVRLASENGVGCMALTDHDSTNGLKEAIEAGQALGVRVIAGIELSADVPRGEVHMLGLFLDADDPGLQQHLGIFRDRRVDRAREMVDSLQELGAPVEWARVLEIAGQAAVGRPHVAQALLEAGCVATIKEAFDRFLARNGPAYSERQKLTPAACINLIHSARGVAVVAHPREGEGVVDRIPELARAGLDGVEVYYWTDYGPGSLEELEQLCARHGLVPSGGSDYHGFPLGASKEVTNLPGSVAVPPETLDRLWRRRVERFGD